MRIGSGAGEAFGSVVVRGAGAGATEFLAIVFWTGTKVARTVDLLAGSAGAGVSTDSAP